MKRPKQYTTASPFSALLQIAVVTTFVYMGTRSIWLAAAALALTLQIQGGKFR